MDKEIEENSGIVSVIIPAYNRENYIDECIESVVKQTYEKWEIILIDDGSTDGTFKKAISWSEYDARIKVFKQENQGPGPARNRGMKEATGEYIAFLDSDDFWRDEHALKKIMCAINNQSCDVIGTFYSIYKNGKFLEIPRHRDYVSLDEKGKWIYFRDEQDCLGFCSYLYRKDFLVGNNIIFPNHLIGEDPPFLAKILACAEKYYVIPVELASIRYRYKNIFTSNIKINAYLGGMLDVIEIAKSYNLDKLIEQTVDRINSNSRMIVKSFLNGNIEALQLVLKIQKYVKDEKVEITIVQFIKRSLIMDIKGRIDTFLAEVCKTSKMIIYGSGTYGKDFLQNVMKLNVQIDIVFAETKEPTSRMVCGKKCYRLDELVEYKEDSIIIVAIKNKKMQDEMISHLKQLGFINYILYDYNLAIVLETWDIRGDISISNPVTYM